ncbi:MAG: Gfo/Idh/MocA family protein [Caldilineaceae bacterium]
MAGGQVRDGGASLGSGQDRRRLGVALVGAGIFAREAHLPAWLELQERSRIVAVTARSAPSAEVLAAQIPYDVAVELDYDRLLARSDVDAVDLVLPIDIQPEFIRKAFAAGKAVVSEKPIAPDVATAHALIEQWRSSGLLWMVAENWRYESAFRRAAQIVADGTIGKPITAAWMLNFPIDVENKYYHTAWRRTGGFPGGFLMDGGVHHIAVLRMLLGEVESVQARVRQVKTELPPSDTMSATLRFASGALASYTVTYAAPFHSVSPLEVMGSAGRLRVDRDQLQVTRGDESTHEPRAGRDGVLAELAAFVAAALDGAPHDNSPEQALADVAVIEAMLRSAQSGRAEGAAT